MSDKREWQEFQTVGDSRPFLGIGDEVLLRDTPDMKKWRGKQGTVVRVNPKTISLNIEGDDRGLRVRPGCIAKFRPADADSFRKAVETNAPEDTGSAVCPGAKALRSECVVGDVVLMDRGRGLFNIIRITRFEATKVAGVVIGGNSSMIGKTRLFKSAWYVQKMDQARFPKQD
ncbi:MAG: hypothetical protein ACE5EC_10005 [Phycisphaerae bacterium]